MDSENDLPKNYDKKFRRVILSEARELHTRGCGTRTVRGDYSGDYHRQAPNSKRITDTRGTSQVC
jgi:hypothetical protein